MVAEINAFFEPLVREYRAYRKMERRFNEETAARFNLVGIWQPSETQVSRILAALLDPNGPHGQGGVYLKEFVRTIRDHARRGEAVGEAAYGQGLLDEEALWFDRAAVRTEETIIGARRIDIYMEVPRGGGKRILIGIENKPWAGEQDAQIRDYVKGLRDRCKQIGGLGPVLLYLTADGRRPTTWSERDADHVLCVSYPGFLKKWIEESMAITRPDKLRNFLRDFSFWIDENFQRLEEEG